MSAGRVEPRVTWPRSVVSGEPFLVSVDLALVDDASKPWPFEGEEIEFTCVLGGARHFQVEAVHDGSVVLHRFGGSYGPAQFMVTARRTPGRHALRLTPLTSHGIVMGTVEVPVEVHAALTEQGDAEELGTVEVVAPLPASVASPPGRRALCVVVSHCESLGTLGGAHEAGRRVVDALTALGYECTVLNDPTRNQLLEETDRFLSGENSEEHLRAVYFSGHGLLVHGDLVLATTDTDRPSSGIVFHQWQDRLTHMTPFVPTLFLVDTCYAGRAVSLLPHGATPPAYVVASCAGDESSYNHLFSNSVADVLELAAAGRLASGQPGTAVPLSTVVERIDQRMRDVMPDLHQTVTSSLTVPRPPDPAFIPVVVPPAPAVAVRTTSLRVLGVHGFGNQFAGPHALTRDWLPAIQDGIHRVAPSADVSAIDLTMAFFADLLRPRSAQGPERPGDEDDENVTAAEAEVITDWIAAAEGAQPRRKLNVYTAVRRMASLMAGGAASGPMERLLVMGLRDLSRYFQHELRGEVTARIHRSITETRPHVMLAHSLGSVAAYEALWREPFPKVDTLVTTGSPLGLKPVVDRLETPEHARPPGVNRWFNLAGSADVVAIPRDGVPKHYQGVMHQEIDTGTSNAHAVTSYLGSPGVAIVLADLLRRARS
ncbi:caspase family protein [Streptomyces sp. NPDC058251]|uniref:caspase family protein n=1 Tax=Streptomyces sp. NPDC058251 TaxID=3346404 RepID=UPI0036E8C44D